MSSSPAVMAASRMMSNSKASLQHLIRIHLRPSASSNATAAATATATAIFNQSIKNDPGSFLSLSELRPFMRRCIAQDFVASEIRSLEYRNSGQGPIQFRFDLAAEHFIDQSRIDVRGRPIKIDDNENNYDEKVWDLDDDEQYDSDMLDEMHLDEDDDSDGDDDGDDDDDDDDDDGRYKK